MATIQEINSSIMFGNLSNEQLDSIVSAIKFARANLARQNRRAVTIGSMVKFVNSRTGKTELGKVSKIMTKNVIVDAGITRWRVPANMLTVHEG